MKIIDPTEVVYPYVCRTRFEIQQALIVYTRVLVGYSDAGFDNRKIERHFDRPAIQDVEYLAFGSLSPKDLEMALKCILANAQESAFKDRDSVAMFQNLLNKVQALKKDGATAEITSEEMEQAFPYADSDPHAAATEFGVPYTILLPYVLGIDELEEGGEGYVRHVFDEGTYELVKSEKGILTK